MLPQELYLHKQVVSLELSQRLQQVGAPQRSLFVWERTGNEWRLLMRDVTTMSDGYSAFMVSELAALLPSEVAVYKQRIGGHWECGHIGESESFPSVRANTMADAIAKMLIELIEQGNVRLPFAGGSIRRTGRTVEHKREGVLH